MDITDYLEACDPEAIRFTGLDEAIIGTNHLGELVYCYDLLVQHFVKEDGMTQEEAVEWIDFNVIGTNAGQGFSILYR